MAFGPTNTTATGTSVGTDQLGLLSNYGKKETATACTYTSKASAHSPKDVSEYGELRSRTLTSEKEKPKSHLAITYPWTTKGGTYQEFGSKVELVDRNNIGTEEDPIYVDELYKVTISITAPNSANSTSEKAQFALERCLSFLRKNDGSWRFDDLMAGIVRVEAN